MKIAGSYSRTMLFAALAGGLFAAAPVAAQQQDQSPAVNPAAPAQPPVAREAQPGGGPGSQPMTAPPTPAAQAPAPGGAAPSSTTAQAPTPPPSWQQGRPEAHEAVKLAP